MTSRQLFNNSNNIMYYLVHGSSISRIIIQQRRAVVVGGGGHRMISSVTPIIQMPSSKMKPGTQIPGLGIFKGHDPPIVQSNYPEWFETLTKPKLSLAKLRKMPNEDAKEQDIQRFLKLQRRLHIRQSNEESSV